MHGVDNLAAHYTWLYFLPHQGYHFIWTKSVSTAKLESQGCPTSD